MAANDNVEQSENFGSVSAQFEADSEARRQAIAEYVRQEFGLVEIIAGQIANAVGAHVDSDELLGAGREGLFDAARRFDPSRGVPFRAYANIRIQGAILDHVRHSACLPRRAHERLKSIETGSRTSAGMSDFVFSPASFESGKTDRRAEEDAMNAHLASVATAMAASISVGSTSTTGEGESDDGGGDPEVALEHAELVNILREALSTLEPCERAIVRRLYFEEKSLMEVATEMSVTKSWVFRVHSRVLARLTKIVCAAF